MMKISAHAKYQIIYDTMQKNDNLLNVRAMCKIVRVSPVQDITIISHQKAYAGKGGTEQTGFPFNPGNIPAPRIP